MPRIMKIGLIMGTNANTDTRYIPGSGAGATSTSNRRALKRRSNKALYPGEPDNKTGCTCTLNNPNDLAFPHSGQK